MSLHYINRSHDEEIIDIVRSIMDNGTGKAETAYEHILIKLMQLRGTPMTSFEFDQEKVDFHYNLWCNDSSAEILESDKIVNTNCPICGGNKKTAEFARQLGYRPDIAFAKLSNMQLSFTHIWKAVSNLLSRDQINKLVESYADDFDNLNN